MKVAYLLGVPALLFASIGTGFVSAPSATADCVNAGGSTICSQGDVRGSDTGPGAGYHGPAYPSSCVDLYYCFDDDWDLDIGWDPGPPGWRPGGGGGIGPRR